MNTLDNSIYTKIEEGLLYTDKILEPLKGFLERCFDKVNPTLSEGKRNQILTTLLNLVGTEIEGEEISFGLIITDSKKILAFITQQLIDQSKKKFA